MEKQPEWNDLPAILTPEEAAAFLRVHMNTLLKLLKTGEIPARRVGRAWRINRADLLRYMNLEPE